MLEEQRMHEQDISYEEPQEEEGPIDEPQTFQHAWWNPDKNARDKWHEAIRLEFNKMIKMGVWREVNKF